MIVEKLEFIAKQDGKYTLTFSCTAATFEEANKINHRLAAIAKKFMDPPYIRNAEKTAGTDD